jgi:hypothetical protein
MSDEVLVPEVVETRPEKLGPAHVRSDRIATQVKTLASFGLSRGSISVACQVTPYVLDKYYLKDMQEGQADMQKRIAAMAFEAAENGSVPMIMYLAKTKLGWVESTQIEHVGEVRAVVSNRPLTTEEFKRKYLEED